MSGVLQEPCLVLNRNWQPVTFLPEFELVTRDLLTTHLDEPQPHIVEQLRKIEDPTGVLNLQTTISISKRRGCIAI